MDEKYITGNEINLELYLFTRVNVIQLVMSFTCYNCIYTRYIYYNLLAKASPWQVQTDTAI